MQDRDELADIDWLKACGFESRHHQIWTRRYGQTTVTVALSDHSVCIGDGLNCCGIGRVATRGCVRSVWEAVAGEPLDRFADRSRFDPAAIELPETLNHEAFAEKWQEWCRYRAKAGKRISETAAKRQVAKLAGIGVAAAIRCIESSIDNDYQGLFPEKFRGEAARTQNAGGRAGGNRQQAARVRGDDFADQVAGEFRGPAGARQDPAG